MRACEQEAESPVVNCITHRLRVKFPDWNWTVATNSLVCSPSECRPSYSITPKHWRRTRLNDRKEALCACVRLGRSENDRIDTGRMRSRGISPNRIDSLVD